MKAVGAAVGPIASPDNSSFDPRLFHSNLEASVVEDTELMPGGIAEACRSTVVVAAALLMGSMGLVASIRIVHSEHTLLASDEGIRGASFESTPCN